MKYCFYILLCSTSWLFGANPAKKSNALQHTKENAEYSVIATHEYGDGMHEQVELFTVTMQQGVRAVVDHTHQQLQLNPHYKPELHLFGLIAIGQPGLRRILRPRKHQKPTVAQLLAIHESVCLQPTAEEQAAAKKFLDDKKKYHEQNKNAPVS